jgi:outer membrane protein assembly factor BamB
MRDLRAKKIKGEWKNLQFDRRKSGVTAVALFLLIAMAVSLVALPDASAQGTRQTYAFIGATPNPVGVGQEVLLHVGIKHPLANTYEGWTGITVTVTRPDGHTETLGPYETDSTGGTGGVYVPTMAGNYTLVTNFPEQTLPTSVSRPFTTPAGTTMLASHSPELTLVVTEEPVTYYPGHALPTEYWTRPIDSQIREWNVISASWLGRLYGNGDRRDPLWVQGNEYAPDTAHILWAMPETQGGLAGGVDLDSHSFEIGDAYEGKFQMRIIIAGKLYYNPYAGPENYDRIVCVDLHTGEVLWSRVLTDENGTEVVSTAGFFGSSILGQLMYWDTYDFHGIFDYLWIINGGNWDAFDPFTGDWVYRMEGVPGHSGPGITRGPHGEILKYNLDLNNGYMTLWNSSNIPMLHASPTYDTMAWGQWEPQGKVVNATGPDNVLGPAYTPITSPETPLGLNGYSWNVSIPDDLPPGSVRDVFPGNKVVGLSYSATEVTSWGINLNESRGALGSVLFRKTVTAPSEWSQGNLTLAYQTTSEDAFVLWAIQTTSYYGFSATTGDYMWHTPVEETYTNFYGWTEFGERPVIPAYGNLYSTGVSGTVYCYDLETGDVVWTYDAVDEYSEILFGNNWWLFTLFATDGKVYFGTLEHSPVDPRPRGGPMVCLNATTGDVVFRADGLFRQTLWGGLGIIGDSIIATQDTYDQRIYAIGKGPSATTVMASPKVSMEGNSVLVEGMVTDVSPGTNSAGLEMRFPNGVPAVADDSMSDWMLYVYKQFERPADAVGVEVVVSVLDPNNNCYEVGRTTSDADGFFKLMFTPEVPGEYTIYASFEGSGAYYGSSAQTAVGVEEAPAATPEPTPAPESIADMYFLPMSIGIIVAIIVVGIVVILLLRRR